MTTQMLDTTADTTVDVCTPAEEEDNTEVLYSVWAASHVVVLVI